MSLIQDALKRKREEEALLPPQEPVRPAPTPEAAPEPAPSENGPAPSARRILLILVGVIVLLLIALGLGKLRQTPAPATVEDLKPEPVAIVEEPAPPPPPMIEPTDRWPDLKLMGFASAGGQRMAVINGKMLSAGKRIAGVRVVEIGEDEVVLEYEGERRSLGGSE